MSLRTTSTRRPATSRWRGSVVTLVLHELEDLVDIGRVSRRFLANHPEDLALLEPIAAPPILARAQDRRIEVNHERLVVVEVVVQGAPGGRVDGSWIGVMRFGLLDFPGELDDLRQVGFVVHR